MSKLKWKQLNRLIVECRQCDRLIQHCRLIGERKRRAFLDCDYWANPVPNFGSPQAELLIVGLAPAAHGANRTGRMFTGDRSGDWLFRALHRAGFANQPVSHDRDDRLELFNCAITAVCHCAPPDNKPTREEIGCCQSWMDQTIDLLDARVYIALGQIAWKATIRRFQQRDWIQGRHPKFRHSAVSELPDGRCLIGSYHPSQQNTFTGRLTEAMLDGIFQSAKQRLSG